MTLIIISKPSADGTGSGVSLRHRAGVVAMSDESNSRESRHAIIHAAVMDIGRHLAEFREGGRTAASLARYAGVAEKTVRRIEAGEQTPTLEQALRLCDAMGISITALLGPMRVTRASRVADREPGVNSGAVRLDALSSSYEHMAEEILPPDRQESFIRHSGLELLYVVRGAVRLQLHHDEEGEVLPERDAVQFDAGLTHRLINEGDEDAIILRMMSSDGLRVHEARTTHPVW